MNKDSISKRDVFTLGGIYFGLLLLVLTLPEAHPTLSGIVLGMYALVSYVTIEHIK